MEYNIFLLKGIIVGLIGIVILNLWIYMHILYEFARLRKIKGMCFMHKVDIESEGSE